MLVPQKRLIPGILLVLMLPALAAPPTWWSAGDPPVIDPAAAVNNKGPASIGQAKHMAKSAIEALRPILPTVSNQIETDLTTGANPIVDFSIPDPKTPEWLEKQKAPLLIGQLKAIADPFYTHLNAANPTWLENERTANLTNHPGSIFPWTEETTDDENKSIANIGQLKAVFSLRFESLPPEFVDTDGDGLPDWLELLGVTDPSADNDADGMPNLWEYLNGLNPLNLGDLCTDLDGDGIPNYQDIRANDDSLGGLIITITTPANGTSIN